MNCIYRDPVKTLVIEDEADFAEYLQHVLGQAPCFDYKIEAVGSMHEARERLTSEKYGLVILDLRLPNGRGASLMREVKMRSPDSCNVIITGLSRDDFELACLEACADDFVEKADVDGEELIRRIRNAVVKHRVHKEFDAMPTRSIDETEALLKKFEDNPYLPPYGKDGSDPLGLKAETDKRKETVLETAKR